MKKKRISKAERNFFALLSFFSPRINTELLFFKKFGRLPDLKNPVTLNEKLLKLKLEEYRDSELVRKCADKYRVREYVRERGLESCLNAIEAVYDRAEDIDWDALPYSFAMKWNFGCSYNIICRSKDQLDKKAAKRQMEKWGREPFWAYYSELQYRGVDKKIIVEEFFDRKFQLMRINRDGKEAPDDFSLPKPQRIEEAFEIADRLSWGFPFVRVDLYLTERGVRFGEMTFTPSAALDNKRLPETDLLFGSMV